ncbi:MAG: hypothetical protein EA350_12860 [Gemmatimonadales bacterium]|nr:MAG: hypothetical protein EA350_12860 [Gemmatimonadales bacterium]
MLLPGLCSPAPERQTGPRPTRSLPGLRSHPKPPPEAPRPSDPPTAHGTPGRRGPPRRPGLARETQGHKTLPGLHVLDARPPAGYSGAEPGGEVDRPGHIPGAQNLPWRSTTGPDEAPFLLEASALLALFEDVGVEPGDRIITYCRTGGQAGHLHFVARMLGFEVRFYDGSFVEWSRNPERSGGGDGSAAPAHRDGPVAR